MWGFSAIIFLIIQVFFLPISQIKIGWDLTHSKKSTNIKFDTQICTCAKVEFIILYEPNIVRCKLRI